MISGVAFCPQAPALVPDVGRGLEAELGGVRAACRTAIRRVVTPGSRVAVVGSGARTASFGPRSRGSFAAFGADVVVPLGSDADGPVELPPSLTVGAWLVRDALGADTGARGYAVTGGAGLLTAFDEPTALIVVGDGSACRSLRAPGHLDERAEATDLEIAKILAGGDGSSLHGVAGFGGLGAELLIAGGPAWDAVAWELEPLDWDAELLYDDAPFGVGYFVAAWMPAGTPRA